MKINKKTMLFEDLTENEVKDLLWICEALILTGKIPNPNPYFDTWAKELEFDERQRLMVLATVFPQRAFLSILHQEKRVGNDPGVPIRYL